MVSYSVRIAELRKMLNAFGDAELVAFCQDQFQELYVKIGLARGLTKEEIISAIIDYFHRREDFTSLLSVIKDQEPDIYAKYESRLFTSSGSRKEYVGLEPESRKEDWGEAVDASVFWGRTDELGKLSSWILNDRCRLVTLLGMGGIGKSTLTVRLIETVKSEFDYVFWRDLRNAPLIENVIDDALRFYSDQQFIDTPPSVETKISLLVDYFKKQRCLMILDNAESILQGGERPGKFRESYEGYATLIQRIGSIPHKSCLVITSREKPQELVTLEGKFLAVKSLQLTGLQDDAARQLLTGRSLKGDNEDWKNLLRLYGGNPLALKISAVYIEDWFDGDIHNFLSDEVAVFGDIEDLLEQQLMRLPDETKEIMYWLAIERGAVSLSQLEKDVLRWLVIDRGVSTFKNISDEIITPISKEELVETLESLKRRSLIEKMNSHFILQPVIMEYLTKQFVKLVFVELATEKPRLFRSHAIYQAQAKDYVMKSQERFILQPLLKRLTSSYSPEIIETKLSNIINKFREQPRAVPGYIAGNVLNMLISMGADLTGKDFSRLAIWQANLKETNLHEVDFSFSDLSHSTFAEAFDLILAVAYSPKGNLIAAGTASGDVFVWNSIESRQIFVLKGHSNWVRAVAFSPDGKYLASGSGDHLIKIWDLREGQCLRTLTGHTDWIRSLAFSPNATNLASAASDRSVRIWNFLDGTLQKELVGHSDWVWSVTYNKTGSKLASGGNDKKALVWDAETGECLNTFDHPDWVRSVAFNPNNDRLATGCNDGIVRVWDTKSEQQVTSLLGHSDRIWAVTFNNSGDTLASSSFDMSIRLWNTNNGQPIKTFMGHTGWVISIAFNPENNILLSGSEDQSVRLWDVTTGDCIKVFRGHTNCFQSVDISGNGKLVVSGSTDQTVRLWDINTGECIRTLRGHTNRIQSVAMSLDGSIIVSGGDDQTIRIWDVETGKFPKVIKGHTSWIRCVALSPDKKFIASASDDLSIGISDVETGHFLKKLLRHKGFVATVAFHPKGKYLASGSADKSVLIWDYLSGEVLRELKEHSLRVNAITYSPSGNLLASCSDDGTLIIWDLQEGKNMIKIVAHSEPIKFVCFSQSGNYLISGGDDKLIKMWDITSGKCINTFTGHTNRVWSGVFGPNDDYIVSGGEDETIRIWDVTTGLCEKILHSKRIYENLNITGIQNINDVQKLNLKTLGAFEK